MDRLIYRGVLRSMWLSMKNNAIAIGESRAVKRANGEVISDILTETMTIE